MPVYRVHVYGPDSGEYKDYGDSFFCAIDVEAKDHEEAREAAGDLHWRFKSNPERTYWFATAGQDNDEVFYPVLPSYEELYDDDFRIGLAESLAFYCEECDSHDYVEAQ